MEFYNRKDLEYWRKQAEIGRAIIIEIPTEMLLDLDIEELSRAHNAKISPEELAQWIEENRKAFLEAAKGEEKNMMSLDYTPIVKKRFSGDDSAETENILSSEMTVEEISE